MYTQTENKIMVFGLECNDFVARRHGVEEEGPLERMMMQMGSGEGLPFSPVDTKLLFFQLFACMPCER
jgi:hypothetical protein